MTRDRRRLLIWGAGGHAKVVADLARDQGWRVHGYVDQKPKTELLPSSGEEMQHISERELRQLLERGDVSAAAAEVVALGIGDNIVRLACLDALGEWCAPPLIHSRAAVSESASLGRGSVVFAGAIINAHAIVGRGVIVNTGAIVEHDCGIADAVHVSPGAVLTGGAAVGKSSWIGAGAVLLPGVVVGAASIVGAGAVVTRNVDNDTVVAGNPARILRRTT